MFSTHRTFSLTTGVKSATIAIFSKPKEVAVLYHQTVVVEARASTITLRDGGWDTVSTRHVINQALHELGVRTRLIRHKKQTLICSIDELGKYPSPKDGRPFVSGTRIKWDHPNA